MERVSTDKDNAHTFALLKAVVSNDVDEVRRLIAQDECRAVVADIAMLSRPFPLHYVTLCCEVIWREVDEWRDKEMAGALKRATDKMMEFWKEYYQVDSFPRIDYRTYCDDFFCAFDEDTDEDILFKPKSKFIAFGKREIDVDLYCAVERFQFDRVEELLKQGANPKAEIYRGLNDNDVNFDSWSAMDNIGCEEGFLCSEVVDFLHRLYIKQAEDWVVDRSLFHHILGLAAHSDMYRLLQKYE